MHDFDWLVIGSGFGGSVSALRLAEQGKRVGVVESGRRFADDELPESTWDLKRYFFLPKAGLKGILRLTVFKDIMIASGAGVGGGSLGYANTLYRAPQRFYDALGPGWELELAAHYDTAERMLGVTEVPQDDAADALLREFGRLKGVEDTYAKTRVGVFFGEAGETVPDPYFGGEGPDRTGCTLCARCMVGCPVGAKNTLVKNYLYFAEKRGAQVLAERTVVDIRPLGDGTGRDGYAVVTERSGRWVRKDRRTHTAAGVVVAAGALGTNKLLQRCRLDGGLPRISPKLGEKVRTNSEAVLSVTVPEGSIADLQRRVAITSSVYPDPDTHIETVVYGKAGDSMKGLNTLLVGDGTRLTRPLKLLAQIARRPRDFWRITFGRNWSENTIIVLVMQTLDNAIALRPKRTPFGGIRLQTEQDPLNPNPTFIPVANEFTQWLADRTGGIPQSSLLEATANIPFTAHILGGATIGDVVDEDHRVLGYDNLLVCDGSVVPANIGVNPSLTITAMAERAMSRLLAQEGAADLAGGRLGQLGGEVDDPGVLVRSSVGLDMVLKRGDEVVGGAEPVA